MDRYPTQSVTDKKPIERPGDFHIASSQIHFTAERGGVAALCAAMAVRMAPRGIGVSYGESAANHDTYDEVTLRTVAAEVDIDLPPPAAASADAHVVDIVVLARDADEAQPDAHRIVVDARRSRRDAVNEIDAWRTLRELLRTAVGQFFARRAS